MVQRFKGVKFTFYKTTNMYVKNGKRSKVFISMLNLRISHEIQKHLKIKAGEQIAVMHDFNNEYILYLKNMKYIKQQSGYLLKPLHLTYAQHKKRQIKPCLCFAEAWIHLKTIPKKAKKSSIAKYRLLKNDVVLVDLGIK